MDRYEDARWFKSSRSSGGGACVEVAFVDDEVVAVRDSKDRSGPVLTFGQAAWRDFVADVAAGEFQPPA